MTSPAPAPRVRGKKKKAEAAFQQPISDGVPCCVVWDEGKTMRAAVYYVKKENTVQFLDRIIPSLISWRSQLSAREAAALSAGDGAKE